ncbi:MAG: hypothetical protein SGBAC_009979, partial [Bacillariaceae sp.]
MNRNLPPKQELVVTAAKEPQDIGEASVEPALSLDILALDGGDQKQNKQNSGLSGSKSTADGGHNSSLDFILTIGSSDSVNSTVTIDPTIHFIDDDSIALNDEPSSTSASASTTVGIIPAHDDESNGGKRRFNLPVNANRWMDDSEHPKSVCSRTSYMGILGLTNHLVPIQDDDDEENHDSENEGGRHNKYHNSKNSSYSELISNESSAFEAGSFSTCESFAYNDDEPSANIKRSYSSPNPKSKNRDNIQTNPGEMMELSLKMQQLKGVGSLPLGNDDDDMDDDMDDLGDDALQYDPS